MNATREETAQRNAVLARVRAFVRSNRVIQVADPAFSGSVGDHLYSLEGEDDLLHLAVCRGDGQQTTVEESQEVLSFLLPEIPPGLIWLKPGHYSQHFYLGHDVLLE